MTSFAPGRVLGIDPGLNITGYGVIERIGGKLQIVEAGVIRGGDRTSLTKRLAGIYHGICEVLTQFQPQTVALEELYSHYERPRTSILMGHARGVICLAAEQAGVTVTAYAATKVKKLLTGNGRAPKMQMQQAICREFGLVTPPEPPDVADALAIALSHQFSQQLPTLRELTQSDRANHRLRS